ncbi:malate dehydrogenase [Escherichia sp. 93.1447]|uniref:PD-(D/E)XK nuclease domain-containing protein n=1 Tax=Escherichia sp. 93.1447 TaxID=2723309 RepID=UPI0015940301|nr:malate dehydrogenase [Escherichia sp. 93.1447]MBB2302302.1 malate dehydrogenase [Escherichia sp. 93.1447]
MTQKTLAERFDELEHDFQDILSTKYTSFSELIKADRTYVDSQKYKTWITRVKNLIADSYGKDSDFYTGFINAEKGLYASNYDILTKNLKPVFDAAKADLDYLVQIKANTVANDDDKVELIINLLNKFPAFCRQLKKRYEGRATIDINDEYDVQDLVHALLTLHFDDIRPEEYTPSCAGASSRQDFLLKKERIVIEVKKTRKHLGARQIGEQLLIDIGRYDAHPDCGTLICFVYDPECLVVNPKGVIDDLEGKDTEGKTRVVIAQF